MRLKNKINAKNLNELQKMEDMRVEHLFTAEAIDNIKKLRLNRILFEMGYDVKNKSYNVNMNTGKIEEKKLEQK